MNNQIPLFGSDLAAQLGPDEAVAAHAIASMKEQLLIVLIKRLGGDIKIPVNEIDDTSQDILSISVDPETRAFRFVTSKKN
jgi:hypothetical protein